MAFVTPITIVKVFIRQAPLNLDWRSSDWSRSCVVFWGDGQGPMLQNILIAATDDAYLNKSLQHYE